MTHSKPDNAPLACFICGKQKGQPPERCNGHYDNALTPTGPSSEDKKKSFWDHCIEAAGEIDTWPDWKLDSLSLQQRNEARAKGEVLPKPTNQQLELEALRALLAQRDKRVEDLLAVLNRARIFITYARYELKPKIISGVQFPSQECADKELKRIEAVMKEPV